MAQVNWTLNAINELDDVAEYIALSNPMAAIQLVQTVFEKAQRLEDFPESGRIPPELENFPYREIIVNPLRVFYKIQNKDIFILHVMRQERDLQNFMLGES